MSNYIQDDEVGKYKKQKGRRIKKINQSTTINQKIKE